MSKGNAPFTGAVFTVGTDGKEANGVWLAADLAKPIRWVVFTMASEGRKMALTEGYRPTGIPSDRDVRVESQTSTGGSNQWYQVGRMDQGLTSAIIPGSGNDSKHLAGRAVDVSSPAGDIARRNHLMDQAGLDDTVASESWHYERVGAPKVDISVPETINNIGEDDMYVVRDESDGKVYLVTSLGLRWVDKDTVNFVTKATGREVKNVSFAERASFERDLHNLVRSGPAVADDDYDKIAKAVKK